MLVGRILDHLGLRAAGYRAREVKQGLLRSRSEWLFLSGETVPCFDPKPRCGWIARGRFFLNGDRVESLLVPMLRRAVASGSTELIVLDEVGPVESASRLFRRQLVDCIMSAKSVLADFVDV